MAQILDSGDVALVYTPDDWHPQSGKAVAQAVGTWEKIVDITTTEEVNSITATKEEFPNLAKCKEFVMRFILPKTEESKTLGAFKIHFNSASYTCYFSNSISTSASVIGEIRCQTTITDGLINSIASDKANGQASIVGNVKQLIGGRFLTADINKIYCQLGDTTICLPIGTQFVIYGKVEC